MGVLARLKLRLLLVLVVATALLGVLISYVTKSFAAVTSLHVADLLAFKDAEPLLKSPTFLMELAHARGITGDPLVQQFARQLSVQAAKPIQFQQELPLNRSELRGLPDKVFSELYKSGIPADIRITGFGPDTERAQAAVEGGVSFSRLRSCVERS